MKLTQRHELRVVHGDENQDVGSRKGATNMANNQLIWSPVTEPVPRTTGKGAAQLGEIVVFIDDRTEAAGILEFAGLLADENGARLISVFIQPGPAITPPQTFARGTGISEVIETHQSQLESIEGRQRAQFEDIVRRHVIPESKWRSLSPWSTEVALPAYYADLVIIARPERGRMSNPPGLAESLVLSSGRPIILFPPSGAPSRVRRILVGWNATREAIRAVVDALPLLARAEAVEVLIVDYQRQRARHGQEPGADITRRLAALGAQIEVQRLSSGGQDVGHLLLSQAVAFRADLLVMGAYGHSTLREWLFGGVTRTVLYEAGLPVLMSR
jgi:nucleotide-binding universal stress UspA family protein